MFDITAARETTEKAFSEDKAMIEAQQRIINLTPGRRFRSTTADKGVVLYNRIIEKLVSEESSRCHAGSRSVSRDLGEDTV